MAFGTGAGLQIQCGYMRCFTHGLTPSSIGYLSPVVANAATPHHANTELDWTVL
jgi:hypothetical protein